MGEFSGEGERLVGESESLRLEIDPETGTVEQVENLATGQALLGDAEAPPWQWTPQGSSHGPWHDHEFPPSFQHVAPEPTVFSSDLAADGESATLTWETSWPDTTVAVDARFDEDGSLELWPRLTVGDDVRPPESFTYPVLSSPRSLSSDGAADRLVYPYHSGWLVNDPLSDEPLSAPYPDGYNGCSMQFTAFFEEELGGFYLATHDPHSTSKRLTFGAEEWSVQHDTWDLRRGTSIEYDYPVVIAPLEVGDWYEAAERYRDWALAEAPWLTLDDPDAADRDARRWLHEEVGLAVWGAPSSLDWSPFYEFYADVAGTPLHVCPGWDWAPELPRTEGRDSWFPAQFHEANVEAWAGHHVTPYMMDLNISAHTDDFFEQWESDVMFPYFMFSHVSAFPAWLDEDHPELNYPLISDVLHFLCPTTERFREYHSWRDAKLVADYPLAGVCYDVSSGNPWYWSRCWRTEHGHPPGRGRDLVQAYDELNRDAKAVTREETGEYLVQGVETMVENVIGSVDFYVMRAGAGPVGLLEAWRPFPEAPPGEGRELLPLFEAVYHDVGPVRQDGWLTLAEDRGDLYFWVAARIVLRWGGLLSLHYANNPPERPPDHDGPAEVIDWSGTKQHWDELPAPDDAKIAFTRELATARTSLASDYIGHGRLLRPVQFETETVELDFTQHIAQLPGVVNEGSWTVPSVVHGAWEGPDGTVGLLFADVSGSGRSVAATVDCGQRWGLDLAGASVTVATADGTTELGRVSAANELDLAVDLDPRTVTLVEVGP